MLTVFKEAFAYIKYILLCVSYNIRSSIANKKSLIIQTVAMFINNFVFILFWIILYDNKGGTINGTTFNDIIYLWSVPVMAYGIGFFCFGGMETLCKDIVDGNLDIYLTKPKHSLVSQLTSRSVLSAMGDFLSGLVCTVIAVNGNPLKIVEALFLGIIAALILVASMTSIKLLSFYLGDLTTATNRYTNSVLLTLTIYPEQMFNGIIKVIMYTVAPAMYMAHIPVKLLKDFSISWFLILIAALIFFVWLMFFAYRKGLKKYESGNGVTRR